MSNVILESWKERIGFVSEVRGQSRPFMGEPSHDSQVILSNILENTKKNVGEIRALRSYNESVGRDVPASQMSGIDWFPEHAIDMVSAIYATQVIDDLVSVQSIDSPIGVIRFTQFVNDTTRGRSIRGDVVIDEFGAMRSVINGHHLACERIVDELTRSATSKTVDCYLQRLPVKVDVDARYSDDAYIDFVSQDTQNAYRARKISDSGWKVMSLDAQGREGDTIQGVVFSCDPESGHVVITDNSTKNVITDGDTFAITYFQDLSYAPTDSDNISLRIKTEMIKAVPHKLRANFSFDASYALSKVHGINMEEKLVNAATALIRQERDNEVINILRRQAAFHSTWDRRQSNYYSQTQNNEDFVNELFDCASKINYETKHGWGNWVVVGRMGLNIIKSTPNRFKSAGVNMPNDGAFVVGYIDGGDLKVIYSPYFPEDEYLVGYKGKDEDAGFVVADFLPITQTDTIMLDDFVGRKGLVTYYGTKMINPKMYVSGKILNGR